MSTTTITWQLELVDKLNELGLSVLAIEQSTGTEYLAVSNWAPPSPQMNTLQITGKLLGQNLHALVERARVGGPSAMTEVEQRIAAIPLKRRQYSPDHRWTLYDAHPAQNRY